MRNRKNAVLGCASLAAVITIVKESAKTSHWETLPRRMLSEGPDRMRKGRLSRKEALLFSLLAISGFVALLYLATFAQILLLAGRTGLVVIKGDSLMLAESAIMLSACIVMGLMTIYSLAAVASELRFRRR